MKRVVLQEPREFPDAREGEETTEALTHEAHLRRLLDRERRARAEAEARLEARSRDLREINCDLAMATAQLQTQVEELKQERERAAILARTDCVSGLLNRCAFKEAATRRLARLLQTPGATEALFSLDLDRFKYVNDTYGHAAGDKVLRVVGERLRAVLGEDALAARQGGDEFTAMSKATDAREAAALGEAIAGRMAEPIEYEGAALVVGASVGVTLAPGHADELDKLLRFADLALYAAKKEGRGGAVLFTRDLHNAVRLRRITRRRLAKAIDNGEIEAWFQPIVDARLPGRRKLEVLARWRDPDRGVLNPDHFVPVAEEAGLIGALDAAVLRSASARLKGWFEAGLIDAASCNVSMAAFQNMAFAAQFLGLVADLGLDGGRLIAEITESAAVEDPELARRHIDALAVAGVRVALDDFGSGYTNLRALADLPVHGVKFDRSLLREVASDARVRGFFEGAVQMAQALGVKIVAEGVETRRQAALARRAGCDDLQGFLFSRPLSAEQCDAWLRSGAAT